MSQNQTCYRPFYRPNEQRMLCFGHRGLSSRFPENTIQSVTASYMTGADGYEVDIQGTQGQAIVLHDPELRRTAKGWMPAVSESIRTEYDYHALINTPVCQLPFEVTQYINVGSLNHPEPPPALVDMLVTNAVRGFFGLIEAKTADQESHIRTLLGFKQALISAAEQTGIKASRWSEYIALISFDADYLIEQRGLLRKDDSSCILTAYWLRGFRFNPEDRLDDERYVYRTEDLKTAKSANIHFDVESCEEAKIWIPEIRGAGFDVGVWVSGDHGGELNGYQKAEDISGDDSAAENNMDRDDEKPPHEPCYGSSLHSTDGAYYASMMSQLDCLFFTTNLPDDMR